MEDVRMALANLLDVVERMDAHTQAERPTEEEYQHALEKARLALGIKPKGGQ